MRLKLTLLLSVFMLVKPYAQDDFWLGAIHVAASQDAYYFPAVAECEFNVVQLTRYANQKYWDQSALVDTNQIESFKAQLDLIKAEKMKAIFIPRVHLENNRHNQFLWHGMILPQSDIEIKKWFTNYWNYLKPYLELCESYELPLVAIGSELNALVEAQTVLELPSLYTYFLSKEKQWLSEEGILKYKDRIDDSRLTDKGLLLKDELSNLLTQKIEQQYNWSRRVSYQGSDLPLANINERRKLLKEEWKNLIAQIRTVYSGALTYAANFDSYKEVAFWDQLDYMGLNAYFPLTRYKPACKYKCKLKEASKSWDVHLTEVKSYMQKNGLEDKEVVFTEIGYSRLVGSTYQPWKADGFTINPGMLWDDFIDWSKQSKNTDERLAAIRSLQSALQKTSFPLKGLMYWELSNETIKLDKDPFGVKPNKELDLIKALNTFR